MKKEQLNELMNNEIKPKTLLVIQSKPVLSAKKKGVELNEGYDFSVDGAIPEIADAIAKFALELPKNGFGPDSGSYFITLVGEYYKKLTSTDAK